MNTNLKRSSIVILGLGTLALGNEAITQLNPQAQPDNPSSANPATKAAKQSNIWSDQFIQETVQVMTGLTDTVSASSGSTWEDTSNGGSQPTNDPSIEPVGGVGSENGGPGIGGPAIPPEKTPNLFTSPNECIAIGLPLLPDSSANCTTTDGKKGIKNDPATGGAIVAYAKDGMRLLSGGIGGIIVLMIVISGVQYITSMGNPGQITAAKNRLTNAITALVLFIMAFAIVNFLVPGGIAG